VWSPIKSLLTSYGSHCQEPCQNVMATSCGSPGVKPYKKALVTSFGSPGEEPCHNVMGGD
jgi:hypothetical protein